jgi:hypothetical protein
MSSDEGVALTYDRDLLLLDPKRKVSLDLWEVLRYGADSYGDVNCVSVYGLQAGEWYARGIRLVGGTAVECTRDEPADAIGQDIAATASSTSRADLWSLFLSPDPAIRCTGSSATYMERGGSGFEIDPHVHQLTEQNLSIPGLPVEFVHSELYARSPRTKRAR